VIRFLNRTEFENYCAGKFKPFAKPQKAEPTATFSASVKDHWYLVFDRPVTGHWWQKRGTKPISNGPISFNGN